MADPRFKVRRQAYFKRGITTASTLNVTGAMTQTGKITAAVGIDTTSGSVSTFSGGLTGASTVTVTGSAIFGTGGTAIAGILAGSGEVVFGAVAASTASATCFTVTGLTVAHKIFVNAACVSACATTACVYANPATPTELVYSINNNTSEALGAGTSTVHYLAILDK
jgi:hypothetical protein